MTQQIKDLPGPFRVVARNGAATRQDEQGFWKYCHHLAAGLILASATVIGSLYTGTITSTVQEAYFFTLRSIGTVSDLATAILPNV